MGKYDGCVQTNTSLLRHATCIPATAVRPTVRDPLLPSPLRVCRPAATHNLKWFIAVCHRHGPTSSQFAASSVGAGSQAPVHRRHHELLEIRSREAPPADRGHLQVRNFHHFVASIRRYRSPRLAGGDRPAQSHSRCHLHSWARRLRLSHMVMATKPRQLLATVACSRRAVGGVPHLHLWLQLELQG